MAFSKAISCRLKMWCCTLRDRCYDQTDTHWSCASGTFQGLVHSSSTVHFRTRRVKIKHDEAGGIFYSQVQSRVAAYLGGSAMPSLFRGTSPAMHVVRLLSLCIIALAAVWRLLCIFWAERIDSSHRLVKVRGSITTLLSRCVLLFSSGPLSS